MSYEGADLVSASGIYGIAAVGAIVEGADGAAALGADYTNTSATGGYLAPLSSPAPQPLEDDDLDDFFQAMIVGITQLPVGLVRPFWQLEPAIEPPIGTTWIAFGVEVATRDPFAFVGHFPAVGNTPGYDQMRRDEVLEITVRGYGPAARSTIDLLRDGLQIAQNREPLYLANMGLVDGPTEGNTVPVIMKERWLLAVQTKVRIRRRVIRNYPVLDLLHATGTIQTDVGFTDAFNV